MSDESRRVMPYKPRPNNTRDIESDILVALLDGPAGVTELRHRMDPPMVSESSVRGWLRVMYGHRSPRWVWTNPTGRGVQWLLTDKGREVARWRKQQKARQ